MRKIFLITLILVLLLALGLPWVVSRMMEPPVREEGTIVRVYRHATGKIELVPLEDYVTGVVAAEMPAEFPSQALMAQAVAARTYIYKRMVSGGVVNNPHPGADTCDDPKHAQAWMSRQEMKQRWGTVNYYRYYFKIRLAVDDTAGEIITYRGQPIDPVFHASCGGRTENSEDVWKFEVPYLRSVACPYDAGPQTGGRVTLALGEVEKALGVDLRAVAATAGNSDAIRVVERTSTGRPKTLLVGDRRLPATEVRERLNLRSTNFTWRLEGDKITFNTTGYGHGVGMCQYGARGLAEHGYGYRRIIQHYYTGVQINNINDGK